MMALGLDIGSTTVKLVLLKKGRVAFWRYEKSLGEPLKRLGWMLGEFLGEHPECLGLPVGITGSGGELAAKDFPKARVNEIIALGLAHRSLFPEARTLIEIGGQDAKLLFFTLDGALDRLIIEDFALNQLCAAGTGGFLEEQALRLGIPIEAMGSVALTSKNPAPIAGRCSVFAKSDMIHLQQVGTPLPDILYGLCVALARNFKATLGAGKRFRRPVYFEGGVAANVAMVRAFNELLGDLGPVFVPEPFKVMAAIGAATHALLNPDQSPRVSDFLASVIQRGKMASDIQRREALVRPPDTAIHPFLSSMQGALKQKATDQGSVFLGVDVGSVSTNIVALDDSGRLLKALYERTKGDPIQALTEGLRKLGGALKGKAIAGVGVTGSGRYLIGAIIGADTIKTEITAQAKAAEHLAPGVDTVFEIGGQDAKFIRVQGGNLKEFAMNRACAAGTGSFLEEVSKKIGVELEAFEEAAFRAKAPCAFGERCTVFMESDVIACQQRGAEKEDLLAGLAFAIAENYFNRVVGSIKLGDKPVFLGGVAKNKAVVAAFNKRLGKEVYVPKAAHVSGAIGAALLAMGSRPKKSRFRGFEIDPGALKIDSFRCKRCANACLIQTIKEDDGSRVFLGSRCERFGRRGIVRGKNLFEARQRLLDGFGATPGKKRRVGFPRMGPYYDYWPFFVRLFDAGGVELIPSNPSSLLTLERVQEANMGDICLPVKILAGHLGELDELGLEAVFVPGILSHMAQSDERTKACPYLRALPSLAQAAFEPLKTPILEAFVEFQDKEELTRSLEPVACFLGVGKRSFEQAVSSGLEALKGFRKELSRVGTEALKGAKGLVIAVIGRMYNTADPFVSLRLPDKIAGLGVDALPMDMLPLNDQAQKAKPLDDGYWFSQDRILKAGAWIKDRPSVYGAYFSNFGCGPDAFIQRFFEEGLKDKPWLLIEADEHSADAGVMTRLEAFLERIA